MLIITRDQEQKVIAAVEAAMKAAGLSQNKLAEKVNLPQATLNRAMRGKSALSVATWKLICDALGLDMDAILAADGMSDDEAEQAEAAAEETAAAECQEDASCANDGATDACDECVPEKDADQAGEGVLIHAPQEDLYGLFLFCEEMMRDCLRAGTRMEPEQLYRLMKAMYALQEASLVVQEGERY